MIGAFDISTSGLVAQRIRLNAISSNLANMSTLRDENGEVEPYQARYPVFETDSDKSTPYGASGVKVASVETEDVEPRYKYQPNHPLAIKEGPRAGYVAYPNINMINEFTDALEATRAYEANIGVIEATKAMGNQTLRIVGERNLSPFTKGELEGVARLDDRTPPSLPLVRGGTVSPA